MTDEQIWTLVEHRLEKSEEALRAAQSMFDQGMLIFAMNRIYYSMYYSVQALFALQGKSFSKHGQIKGFFNREYVKSGKLSKDMGRLFNYVLMGVPNSLGVPKAQDPLENLFDEILRKFCTYPVLSIHNSQFPKTEQLCCVS